MSSRASAVSVLADSGRGNTGGRVGFVTRSLVVFQVVVTFILLVGSILQVRSILNQQKIDYGYDTGSIMSAHMGLMEGAYPTSEARKLFYDRLLLQLHGSAQFESVALSSRLRMVFAGSGPIEIEGKVYKARRDRTNANFEQVTAGFFNVMGQKVIEGRDFTDQDLDATQPVAIVNAAFVAKHFGRESALGRRFRTGDGSTPQYGPWRTIVGVVTTVRMMGPGNNPNVDATGFYVPFYSAPFGPAPPGPLASQFATVIVKPRGGQRPEAVLPALRNEVSKADPNLPLSGSTEGCPSRSAGARRSSAFGWRLGPTNVASCRWCSSRADGRLPSGWASGSCSRLGLRRRAPTPSAACCSASAPEIR